jgi:hypothetical protein
MMDLVNEAFYIKELEGLGRVFVCKVCGAVFVSAVDSERHIKLYHRIFSKKRLEEVEASWLSARTASTSKRRTLLDFV